jgi:hypothetical protein
MGYFVVHKVVGRATVDKDHQGPSTNGSLDPYYSFWTIVASNGMKGD